MSDSDVFGPIEFAVVGFPDGASMGQFAAALGDAVDAGIIQIYDVLALRKGEDGSVSGFELSDLDGDGAVEISVFAGARSGLLDDDDVARAGATIDPGTIAVLIVYENLWAVSIVAAAQAQGGALLAGTTVSAQQIVNRLDVLEAAD